jgi:hypothetical protein
MALFILSQLPSVQKQEIGWPNQKTTEYQAPPQSCGKGHSARGRGRPRSFGPPYSTQAVSLICQRQARAGSPGPGPAVRQPARCRCRMAPLSLSSDPPPTICPPRPGKPGHDASCPPGRPTETHNLIRKRPTGGPGWVRRWWAGYRQRTALQVDSECPTGHTRWPGPGAGAHHQRGQRAAPAVRSGARSARPMSRFYCAHCLLDPVQALTTSAGPVQRTCPLCEMCVSDQRLSLISEPVLLRFVTGSRPKTTPRR